MAKLINKFGLNLNNLTYEYVNDCSDKKILERILKILRSGEEGSFPNLEKKTEDKLRQISPESYLLREDASLKRKTDIPEKVWSDLEVGLKDWEREIKKQDTVISSLLKTKNMNLPKIREPQNIQINEENAVGADNVLKGVKSKIRRDDYQKWDKFDPDEEVMKLEVAEERQREEEKREHFLQQKNEKDFINAQFNIQNTSADVSEEARAILAEKAREKGNEYFKAGELSLALAYYNESMNYKPTCPACNNRAMTYIKLGRHSEALADCNFVLKSEPLNVKALMRRATCYKSLSDWQKAFGDVEKVLSVQPNNSLAKADRDFIRKKLNLPDPSKVRLKIEDAHSELLPVLYYGASTSSFVCLPGSTTHFMLTGSRRATNCVPCICTRSAHRRNPLCVPCGERVMAQLHMKAKAKRKDTDPFLCASEVVRVCRERNVNFLIQEPLKVPNEKPAGISSAAKETSLLKSDDSKLESNNELDLNKKHSEILETLRKKLQSRSNSGLEKKIGEKSDDDLIDSKTEARLQPSLDEKLKPETIVHFDNSQLNTIPPTSSPRASPSLCQETSNLAFPAAHREPSRVSESEILFSDTGEPKEMSLHEWGATLSKGAHVASRGDRSAKSDGKPTAKAMKSLVNTAVLNVTTQSPPDSRSKTLPPNFAEVRNKAYLQSPVKKKTHFDPAPKDDGSRKKALAEDARRRGDAMSQSGMYPLSLRYYTTSINLCPQVSTLLARANDYIQMQNYSEAVEDCTKALRMEPSNVQALLRRATAYIQMPKDVYWKLGLDDLEKVVNLKPTDKSIQEDANALMELILGCKRSCSKRLKLKGHRRPNNPADSTVTVANDGDGRSAGRDLSSSPPRDAPADDDSSLTENPAHEVDSPTKSSDVADSEQLNRAKEKPETQELPAIMNSSDENKRVSKISLRSKEAVRTSPAPSAKTEDANSPETPGSPSSSNREHKQEAIDRSYSRYVRPSRYLPQTVVDLNNANKNSPRSEKADVALRRSLEPRVDPEGADLTSQNSTTKLTFIDQPSSGASGVKDSCDNSDYTKFSYSPNSVKTTRIETNLQSEVVCSEASAGSATIGHNSGEISHNEAHNNGAKLSDMESQKYSSINRNILAVANTAKDNKEIEKVNRLEGNDLLQKENDSSYNSRCIQTAPTAVVNNNLPNGGPTKKDYVIDKKKEDLETNKNVGRGKSKPNKGKETAAAKAEANVSSYRGKGNGKGTSKKMEPKREGQRDALSTYQFYSRWEGLKKRDHDFSQRMEILRTVPPDRLSSVIGEKLDGDMLSELVQCLQLLTPSEPALAGQYLSCIPTLPRFTPIKLFMEPIDMRRTEKLLETLEKYKVTVEPSIKRLLL